jgi:predicted RND superfamily exporter protein
VLGFSGREFDMPICVQSTLSLGMVIGDFAIHVVARFREALADRQAKKRTPTSSRW